MMLLMRSSADTTRSYTCSGYIPKEPLRHIASMTTYPTSQQLIPFGEILQGLPTCEYALLLMILHINPTTHKPIAIHTTG